MLGNNAPKTLEQLLAERGIPAPGRQPAQSPLLARFMSPPSVEQMTLAPVPVPDVTPGKPSFFGGGGAGWKILGSLGDALTAAGGGHGNYIPAMLERQRMAMEQQRLDAQNTREDARLAKPSAIGTAGGGVAVFDPTTGTVKQAIEGQEKTAIQKTYEWLQSTNPALAEQYLRAQANPMTLMTDPTSGAVGFYPKGGMSSAGASAGGGGPAQVSSQAQYQALPPGTPYIAPDGSHRVKGGPSPTGSATFR